MLNLPEDIQKKLAYWTTSPHFDEKTRHEVSDLIERAEEQELIDRFYRDLEFGTGGMRGILGAGSCRMNIYNIRKATCALADYLREFFGNKPLKIAISYDSRQFSSLFARAAAEVLAFYNIKVLLTEEMRPVPYLSFLVRHFKCDAGICVTASHNPPEYNGFKVYWGCGGQIVAPHDKNIVNKFNAIKNYDIPFIPFAEAVQKDLIQMIKEQDDKNYLDHLKTLPLHRENNKDLKIVYSPLHGSGIFLVPKALRENGFEDIFIVPEQSKPDPRFPTVKAPNPENEQAIQLALSYALKQQADIVFATDPDCDRLGVLVRDKDEWIRLNGNEMGSLLIEYVLSQEKNKNNLTPGSLILKTIVTTDLQEKIAEAYGAQCISTLPGFKWIGAIIEEYEKGLRKPFRPFIAGSEESYGFLAGSFVRDKDAVIASVMMADMAYSYKKQNKSLIDVLNNLYQKYGFFTESLKSITYPGEKGQKSIFNIMTELRKTPPSFIDQTKVIKFIDYMDETKTNLPKAEILQIILSDDTKITIRPSGTEPILKVYVAVRKKLETNFKDLSDLKTSAKQYAEHLIQQVFTLLKAVKN